MLDATVAQVSVALALIMTQLSFSISITDDVRQIHH